jgi:hypothetical protein
MAHLQAYDQTLRGFIVPDDQVDEGNGSAREPEGTGGSAAAEGADASAAGERTHSGRRARRADGAMRGQRYAANTSLLLFICHLHPVSNEDAAHTRAAL